MIEAIERERNKSRTAPIMGFRSLSLNTEDATDFGLPAMDTLVGFEKIAPFLGHPLVLVGFVILLFFGIHRALLKAKVIPPMTKSEGSKILRVLLRYGFIIALAVILFGFGLEAYSLYRSSQDGPITDIIITGKIEDSNSEPVHNARITIDGYDFEVRSKENGTFTASLPGAEIGSVITLRVSHSSYESYSEDRKISGQEEAFAISIRER